MMKLVLLLFVIPMILCEDKGPSSCDECGGKCIQACGDDDIELPSESESKHCWGPKNICCIPKAETKCYAAGGACLTNSACITSGGVTIVGMDETCTTVRKNQRVCCAIKDIGIVCPAPIVEKPEPPVLTTCPEEWTEYEGVCYNFFPSKSMNRAEALDFCITQQDRATLAILDSRAKVDFAADLARQHFGKSSFQRFWLGGQYDTDDKKYYWDEEEQNEIVVKSNLWWPCEPNNKNEHYINFWVKGTKAGINDAYDYRAFIPMCMVKLG